MFVVNHETLQKVNAATREDDTPVYLYAIAGLDVTRDPSAVSPCVPGQMSRWINVLCSNSDVEEATMNLLGEFLTCYDDGEEEYPNFLLDMWHPHRWEQSCHANDRDRKGFEVPDTNRRGRCWKQVHPDHLNVYNFAVWVEEHPGNSEMRNPIQEVADADLDSTSSANEGAAMVCGSPFEVANDPYLAAASKRFQTSLVEDRIAQRQTIWVKAALEDPGQLRQR